MRQSFKRICALFLCVATLCSLGVIPARAADGDEICAIHGVAMEIGADTAYVSLTAADSGLLMVALYDAQNGTMLGIGSADVAASAEETEAAVPLTCVRGEDTVLKAFLLDSTTYAPLCACEAVDESAINTQAKQTIYSITDIEMLNHGGQAEAAVTVNVNTGCVLDVSFYADEALADVSVDRLCDPIVSTSAATPDYCEMETVYLPVNESLPEYFIILAELKDADGNRMADPFLCLDHTSSYARFAEKTVADAAEEYDGAVLNFDEDDTNNFGVLDPGVITIHVSSDVNALTVEEHDPLNEEDDFIVSDFTYYFSNPDQTVLALRHGDCVYVENTEYLFKVGSISVADGAAVIVPSKDVEVTDFYDFLKVNLQSDEPSGDEAQLFASASAAPETSFSENINWHPGGDEDITVTGALSVTNKTELKIAFDANLLTNSYVEYSMKPTTTIKLEGTVTAEKSTEDKGEQTNDKEASDELSIGKVKLPSPVPGLSVYIKPSFGVKLALSGTASVEFQSTSTTGFTYNSKSGIQKADKKESSAKLSAEAKVELTIGPKIAVGATFIEVIDASVSTQAGLKISLKEAGDILTSEDRDYHHACTFCLDGTSKWFLTVDAKLKIDLPGKHFDYSKKWNIVKLEGWLSLFADSEKGASNEAGKFYISLLNMRSSPFGGIPHVGTGTCPNKAWRTEIEAVDANDQALEGVAVNVTGETGEVVSGETKFVAYLYNGAYVAAATLNGVHVRKEFEVNKEKQTVKLEGDVTYFNGHAYKLYDTSMTWTEAKEQCEALGGHLATITSNDEQQFIVSMVSKGSKSAYWLGATNEQTAGQWEWVTGEPWNYTAWDAANHQPDNTSKAEFYLQIYNSPTLYSNATPYKWNDQNNTNSNYKGVNVMGFICEWE